MSSHPPHPISPVSTNPRLLFINGVGQTIITSLTILGSSYLLYALMKQGRGKLRVRLLLGMILGDLLLGVGAFVPNVWTLAGGRFVAGTAGCDAFGFIYTSILFSQHLYTLVIAVATFLLLKHPLSPITSWVERHSMWAMPAIWSISFAHSGAWWAHAGWATSGPLCYYAPKLVTHDLDSRDLVQFIPRAFVFITIIVLYSMLYKFLRRPDTIQLSSQFVSGETGTNTGGERKKRGILSAMKMKARSKGTNQKSQGGVEHSASKIDPNAPWEQLEFVQVGGKNLLSPVTSGLYSTSTTSLGDGATPSSSNSAPSPFSDLTNNGNFTPDHLLPRPQHHRPSLVSMWSSSSTSGTPLHTLSSSRPSQSETLVHTPELRVNNNRQQLLSPVLSQNDSHMDSRSRVDRDIEFDLGPDVVESLRFDSKPRHGEEPGGLPSSQTLGEFFKDDNFGPPGDTKDESRAERGGMSASAGLPQMSATAYFNRQASLLMLYFPLAYMVVFSVSLIRLIYDMIHKDANPVLQIVSAWMVLSVGLIDAIVYGVAEFMVKRKVRRKMGDRL